MINYILKDVLNQCEYQEKTKYDLKLSNIRLYIFCISALQNKLTKKCRVTTLISNHTHLLHTLATSLSTWALFRDPAFNRLVRFVQFQISYLII